MGASGRDSGELEVAVLGGGYAGLRVAQELVRRSRGRVRPTLIDRHPVHVLRTELYEVGRLALEKDGPSRWLVPLEQALDPDRVDLLEGSVERIDLAGHAVVVDGRSLSYRQLAVCLGSVPAYFGVPGAERAHQVYGYLGALAFARALVARLREAASAGGTGRVRVCVVGGGSTGTELAAEVATVAWRHLAGAAAPTPEVTLVVGALPFLDGFSPGLVRHARRLLARARVSLLEHRNVTRVDVEAGALSLEDGTRHDFDLVVWCAGVQAPSVVRAVVGPRGRGGRIPVDPHLEVPGHPGAFAVGDAADLRLPETGLVVPATAQAALAEAPLAARNLLARAAGQPLTPFRYRERGVVVALGLGQAAGQLRGLTLWGSPAALLKAAVDRGYHFATEHRSLPRGL